MATISVTLPSDGTTADVADYNTPITTIVNEINGNLSNANLSSSAAIDGTKLADGSITNAKLSTTAGQPGGVTLAWTPTWVNLSVGNGTVVAKYTQIGKWVLFRLNLVFGSTTSITGTPTFTLPQTSVALVGSDSAIIANAKYLDSGTAAFTGHVMLNSTTTGQLQLLNAGGTYLMAQGVSSTTPMTWTTNDEIKIYNGMFEAA